MWRFATTVKSTWLNAVNSILLKVAFFIGHMQDFYNIVSVVRNYTSKLGTWSTRAALRDNSDTVPNETPPFGRRA